MSNLQAFFAQNVEKVEIEEHVVSKRFKDEKGNPIPWKFGAIDGDTDSAIRKACTKRIPVPGNKRMFMPETDFELYTLKTAVATIKFPDLNNADLQSSYGVMGAENLLQKMLLPGELTEVKKIAQAVNGFDVGMDELVEEAKKLIEDGDGDANIAHYALHKLHMLPSEYLSLERKEKAFVVASIKVKIDAEKEREKKVKQNASKGKGKRRKR